MSMFKIKNIINFFTSNYIRSILFFFIIILIINLILIGNGHFDLEPVDGKEKFKRNFSNTLTDGVYFTTTQISTIGYGDITPQTSTSKWLSTISHILIILIHLNLISEFGPMLNADEEIKNKNISSERLLINKISNKQFPLDKSEKLIDLDI